MSFIQSVSNSIMCSRNHGPIPCCGHDFTHEMVTEFQRWPGFPSHTSLLCHYKHWRRCPDHHSDSSHSNRNTSTKIRSPNNWTKQTENQDVVDRDRELWYRDLGAIVIAILKSIDNERIKSRMWWFVETENCDIVILGQLWQQQDN